MPETAEALKYQVLLGRALVVLRDGLLPEHTVLLELSLKVVYPPILSDAGNDDYEERYGAEMEKNPLSLWIRYFSHICRYNLPCCKKFQWE